MTEDQQREPEGTIYARRELGMDNEIWLDGKLPSTAVVEAVADSTEREPLDMQPLHHFVESDALDSLLTSAAKRGFNDVEVCFRYEGVSVTVSSGGTISVD